MFFFFILLTPSTFLDQFGLSFQFLGYYSFCLSFIPSLIYLFISFSDIISFPFLSFFCFVDGKRIRKKNKKNTQNSKQNCENIYLILFCFPSSLSFSSFIITISIMLSAYTIFYIYYLQKNGTISSLCYTGTRWRVKRKCTEIYE